MEQDMQCAEVSKSGSSKAPKFERSVHALSSFDRDTEQQYEILGNLSCIEGTWGKDLSCVPASFGLDAIRTDLIDSPDKTFDRQSVRVYKSLRAWSLSQGGHVIAMNTNIYPSSNIFMLVRTYCLPSQSTTHTYPVYVCLDKRSGTVHGAQCRCVAGLESVAHKLQPFCFA